MTCCVPSRDPINSNEPLLLFVTGEKGTGKSHLVRWLKSRLGSRPSWHVVYIEKRNTSLRRVMERILSGIDTPARAGNSPGTRPRVLRDHQ